MHNIDYPGPVTSLSQEIDEMKYRQKGESFNDKIKRIARALADDKEHQYSLEDILVQCDFYQQVEYNLQ